MLQDEKERSCKYFPTDLFIHTTKKRSRCSCLDQHSHAHFGSTKPLLQSFSLSMPEEHANDSMAARNNS